ncbi:MAG: methyltransferase domain-containing protein [Cyanobacteria bacterium J06623_7]
MSSSLDLNEYKRAIANFYDLRSSNYDVGEWRQQICYNLLDYVHVGSGQFVLNIGTGTGQLAIAAAKMVGDQGSVVGIDISTQMLAKALPKAEKLALNNVKFQLADAEQLDYPHSYFDYILCAHTFPWISHKEAALKSWHHLLKSGGRIAVHTPADTAYVGAVVLRQLLKAYDIAVEPSNRIGSQEECRNLLSRSGFEGIEIKQEQHGSYVDFDSAYSYWHSIIENPSELSLKVSSKVFELSAAQLATIKSEFTAALSELHTREGVWNDLTTLYLLARKAEG